MPAGAKSLVLIVDDPDAPDPKAPKMTWVHWVLYNLPPTTMSLAEDLSSEDLPKGALEGNINDRKRTGYGGPCPPVGRHRYFHKLYALDTVLPDPAAPTKAKLKKPCTATSSRRRNSSADTSVSAEPPGDSGFTGPPRLR